MLQEVFLKVIERLDSFQGAASPVTWLYRITTNHCLNRLRNERTRRRLLDERAADVPRARSSADPEVLLFVERLWRTLDPQVAQVGVWFHVDGMTHAEIARVLGVSPRTVANRLATLRKAAVRLRRGGGEDS